MTASAPGPVTVDEALVRLAGWMLPGAPSLASPPPDRADALVVAADRARLLGPLVAAVEAGEVRLPPDAVTRLHERHRATLWWCLAIEARLLELHDRFEEAGGVDHLVVKGAAVAHLDEPDPSLRSFADLDLLVAAEHVDRAVAVLEGLGATRPWAQRRPGYDRRFAKSVTLTCPDGIEVDLHRSLCDGVHGFRLPLGRIFDQREHFDVGGRSIGAPGLVHRTLHAAYHVVLGSPRPRLASLRDLGGYLGRGDVEVREVIEEARRWRGEAVLATAVDLAAGIGAEVPEWTRWRASVRVSARERALVDRQRREGSSMGWGKVLALGALPDLRSRTAYGFALAVPSTEHLRSRGLRRRDLLRRTTRSS